MKRKKIKKEGKKMNEEDIDIVEMILERMPEKTQQQLETLRHSMIISPKHKKRC